MSAAFFFATGFCAASTATAHLRNIIQCAGCGILAHSSTNHPIIAAPGGDPLGGLFLWDRTEKIGVYLPFILSLIGLYVRASAGLGGLFLRCFFLKFKSLIELYASLLLTPLTRDEIHIKTEQLHPIQPLCRAGGEQEPRRIVFLGQMIGLDTVIVSLIGLYAVPALQRFAVGIAVVQRIKRR